MQMGCIMRPYFRGGARIFFAGGVLEVTTGRFMRGRSPHVQACSPPTLQPPSQRPIAYRQQQNRPKSDSTSPVKRWHIPLGRVLDDFVAILGHDDRVRFCRMLKVEG